MRFCKVVHCPLHGWVSPTHSCYWHQINGIKPKQLEADLAAAREEIARLQDVDEVRRDNAELNRTFELRWEADMRAIQRWRKEDPIRRRLRQPDHADMVVYLIGELEKAEQLRAGKQGE